MILVPSNRYVLTIIVSMILLLESCRGASEPTKTTIPTQVSLSTSATATATAIPNKPFSTAAYDDDDDEDHHHHHDSNLIAPLLSEETQSIPLPVGKRLTLETMCQNLRKMEYAVRGKVVTAADTITDELKVDPTSHPFDHIVYTNIGNPQSVGQRPLTWPRQVLALVDLPDEHGIDHPDVTKLFPIDAIHRAREIKIGLDGHGSGAYTHSKGARYFRNDVANFIKNRDGGLQADPECIFLTNGASAAIHFVLEALTSGTNVGVMIPIPQYPIYSATVDLLGAKKVGYYLDEESGWSLNVPELERSLQEATDAGITVTALVIINPGNPTGQVLTRDNLMSVIKFCVDHKLVLLSDEVYQENVYAENKHFLSAKRAAYESGYIRDDLSSDLELISFHSVSKGVFGECGRRGGYMELVGIEPDVVDEIYKLASAGLCSTVDGQIMTSLMVRGPCPTDVSYTSHEAEKTAIFDSLKKRSKIVGDGLNSIDGFQCQPAEGSMYCFPSLVIPPKAIAAAQEQGISPDTLYAVSLLENTGICVVPASGFGQRIGRYGFRTTFLPNEVEMERCVQLFKSHYQNFIKQYS